MTDCWRLVWANQSGRAQVIDQWTNPFQNLRTPHNINLPAFKPPSTILTASTRTSALVQYVIIQFVVKTKTFIMASPSFVQSLAATLSSNSRILTDESSEEFKTSMERWSNYGLNVPSAIIQPTNEEEIVATVKELVSASIPFVPAAGGHSCFSSIGKNGVIVDLAHFTGVDVDEAGGFATIKGGTLMKEFQAALHPHKQFAGARPLVNYKHIPRRASEITLQRDRY